MFKNKINIALIALVLTLWGTVAYKHIYKYFVSNETTILQSEKNQEMLFSKIEKENFSLDNIARDPFLNNKNSIVKDLPKQEIILEKPVIIKKPEVFKPEIICPQIEYYGYIKSFNKNEELILIKISDNLYKSRKKATLEDVFLEQIYNDSIVIVFNKKRKVVRLKKM